MKMKESEGKNEFENSAEIFNFLKFGSCECGNTLEQYYYEKRGTRSRNTEIGTIISIYIEHMC